MQLKSHVTKAKTKLQPYFTSPLAQFIFPFLYAFLGTLGGVQLLKFLTPNTAAIANNLLICALVFLLYLYYRQPTKLAHREHIYAIICTIILATILIIGGQLEFYNNIFWNLRTVIKIFCVGFLVYPVWMILIAKLNRLSLGHFTLNPRKHMLIAFGCIFVTTLIVWLILFPGIYTYDMASQNEIISRGGALGEWHAGEWSVAHWSLTYGFLLAGFLDLGNLLFHSYTVGFAIAIFLQMVFICYVEARLTIFATKISQNRKVYILSILFFCLMPFLVVTSISAAQDVLFAGLFALFVINLFEVMFDEAYFTRKINYVKLPLLGFLMCAIRSNGVYCLLFLLLFAVIFYKQPKRKLLLLISIPVMTSFIYSGPFMRLLHIEKSTSIQEILSVPSQQLARVYYNEPDSLSPEETSSLERYYHTDNGQFALYQKHPLIADYTKSSLNINETTQNLGGYIGLWLSVGLKNPDEYIEAFLLNSFGYWYPNKNYADSRLNLDFINYPGYAMTGAFLDHDAHPYMKPIERHSLNNQLASKLDALIFGNAWLQIPIFATFCSMGAYMLLLLFVIGYLITKRHYNFLMPLSLVFGLYLTLLLSPVAIFRYGYPIVMLAPLLIALLFACVSGYTYKAQTTADVSSSRRSKSNS